MRMPSMKIPSINIVSILKNFTRYTLAITFMLIGLLGIGLVSYNPLNVLAPYLPTVIDGTAVGLGTLTVTTPWIEGYLSQFYNDPYIWGSTIAGSILTIFISLLLFSSNPKQFHKTLLYSPITIYRKMKLARDKLLRLVTYLNEESAKWRMTFNVIKSPYSLLRAMGFSPQMALGLVMAGGTVGGGVVVNETVFAERSFARGDSGVYAASVMGESLPLDVPTEYVEGSNTLRIDLGTTPVRDITIENVSIGTVFAGSTLATGTTTVVKVGGNPTASNFTATRLQVGTFIYEKSRCKKVTFSDINAHTIIVRGNASDGQSVAPSPGTARMRAVGGGHHQAEAMITSGGTYDRIWIQAPSSGVHGKIGTLKLSNLYTKGGDCEFSAMDIGTMIVELNETGSGSGFSTKEFIIATTVTGANLTVVDNVEVSISEPATIN